MDRSFSVAGHKRQHKQGDTSRKAPRAGNAALHRENMRAFDYALSLDRAGAPAVWAAWGAVKLPLRPLVGCDMIGTGRPSNRRLLKNA